MNRTSIAAILIGVVVLLAVTVYLRQRAQDSKFPIIYNVANFLDDRALKRIEDVVRAKGEAYPISIAVVSADRALVTVGDDSFTPRSGRIYKIKGGTSGWEIDKVESWKNEP